MEKIDYETFSKIDVRIGTVVAAEIIPDADRLILMKVDLGEEEHRQIVSGIREYIVGPEEMVGKQFPFVFNLEPRTIKGHESNGMIFAAGEADSFTFLTPTKSVPPGTRLR